MGTPAWSGDFHPWRSGALTIGAEAGAPERFRGFVSHLAIFARELDADEIAADAKQALGKLAAEPRVVPVEIEGVLETRARVPTLDEITPYRRALVVERWRVERVAAGDLGEPNPATVRVARWAILDGDATAASRLAPGARARLAIEPYDAQTQLETVFLSVGRARGASGRRGDAATGAARLWFDVGPAGGPG